MWNASWAIALSTSAADMGHDSATILECAETFPGGAFHHIKNSFNTGGEK